MKPVVPIWGSKPYYTGQPVSQRSVVHNGLIQNLRQKPVERPIPGTAKVPPRAFRRRRGLAVLSSLSKEDLHNMMEQSKDRMGQFGIELDNLAGGQDLIHIQMGKSKPRHPMERHNYSMDLEYKRVVSEVSNMPGHKDWNARYLDRIADAGLSLLPLDHAHIPGPFGPIQAPWPMPPQRHRSWDEVTFISECLIIWEWDTSYVAFLNN